MKLDRYDFTVALQLWQRFFVLALAKNAVSALEAVWKEERIAALEYLARGKLMALASVFLDGPVLKQEGDIDLFQAAQEGVSVVRDDVAALVAELESAEGELYRQLADRCAYIVEQGEDAVIAELDRVPEMNDGHLAWFNSPFAAARGRVVARELERAEMPPTSSASNEGFNPAFFPPAAPARFPNRSGSPAARPAPATVAAETDAQPSTAENQGFNPEFFPPPAAGIVPTQTPAKGDPSENHGFNPQFFAPPTDE